MVLHESRLTPLQTIHQGTFEDTHSISLATDTMPRFHESSSSASDTAPEFDPQNSYQRIVSDEEYAASSFGGASELPLSQQLEPIAVVGMGKTCQSL